jgi:hypothetical protein
MAEAHLGANKTRVLLVEDNPADVYLTELLLDRSEAAYELSVARDGDEALQELGLNGTDRVRPLPDLILLDLNLPKIDGVGSAPAHQGGPGGPDRAGRDSEQHLIEQRGQPLLRTASQCLRS